MIKLTPLLPMLQLLADFVPQEYEQSPDGGEPLTQHCKSLGPVQYPGTEVPEQVDVCTHVPDPCGVEHAALVQH